VPTCTVCGEDKDAEAFAFKNKAAGRRHRKCKVCMAAYGRDHYARNRAAYINRNVANNRVRRRSLKQRVWGHVASQACVDCGERDPLVLEFDHLDPLTKRAEIYYLVQRGYAWTTIQDEISRCEVRCANCHRRRTAVQFSWPKLQPHQLESQPLARACMHRVLYRISTRALSPQSQSIHSAKSASALYARTQVASATDRLPTRSSVC